MSEELEEITSSIKSERQLSNRREIIGRGLAFPIALDVRSGVALTDGDGVEAAIYMIIMTVPGERVMRPEFGCGIWSHVFAPINASTLGQMAHAVRQALARWEPRIEVEQVRVVPRRERLQERARSDPSIDGRRGRIDPDDDVDATVDIHVDFVLRSTNDRRNLVFPFYTIPGET